MDILISSNFERFIFDISGNDAAYTTKVFGQLKTKGSYSIDAKLKEKISAKMRGGYANEEQCTQTIKTVFERFDYLMDTHTAVGYQVAEQMRDKDDPHKLLLVSTASPYKFPEAVLEALDALPKGEGELALPGYLSAKSGMPIPDNLALLEGLPILHDQVCQTDEMEAVIREKLGI